MPVPKTGLINFEKSGWGGRIRTCECRYQKPVPYHLATPQQARVRGPYSPAPSSEKTSGVRDPPVDQVLVILRELSRQVANFEIPWPGFADEGHLGRTAGDEHLLETFQLFRPDRSLNHLDPAVAREVYHGSASDPVEETVRRR